MRLFSKLIMLGVSIGLMQFAYADSCGSSCPPKEACPKPCPPKPCPKPCPPKPCAKPCPPKPCPPKPCPKPCPPKPCPPKPCKPCPPVCFEPGYPTNPTCTPCAFNSSAAYELGPCPWDFWIDVSFTYWDAYQEGMDLGVGSTELATVLQPAQGGTFLFQDNSFKPGFKVGIGLDLDMDHWSGLMEYTWFRSTTTNSNNAPNDARGGVPVWILSNWFNSQANVAASSISSKWQLNMDLLDAMLTRPYYQGTHLIIAPFGGLRGQWIRQRLNVDAEIFTSSTVSPPLDATSSNKSHSWAVGPRVGFQAEWHLGWGFRFEGDAAGSLLYTRYNKVSHAQTPTATNGTAVSAQFRDYNTLRAGTDLNVGLGWGSYFDCRNYHFDLLATYDFQIFWNQNIMRQLADAVADGTGHAPANLYLQGFTLRAQFDF